MQAGSGITTDHHVQSSNSEKYSITKNTIRETSTTLSMLAGSSMLFFFVNTTFPYFKLLTLRPGNDATDGSTQEAHMGASCVLPSVASLTGRSVCSK